MLIVITGGIASGKSAIARGVASELEERGVGSAVIDLDLLYDMQAHNEQGPKASDLKWAAARHAAAALADSFMHDGIAAVVVEGEFVTPADRAALVGSLREPASPLFVTLLISNEEALRRAQSDPTRGVSRDPEFLRRHYDYVLLALANVPASDLVIDTERTTEADAVRAISLAAINEDI